VYATPNYVHPSRLQNTIAGGASSIVIPEPEDPGPNPLLPGAPKGSSVSACLSITLGTVLIAEGLLTYLGPQGWVNRLLTNAATL
jgi:hypothetical protein